MRNRANEYVKALSKLSERYAGGRNNPNIIDRESIIELCMITLCKQEKASVLLTGPAGVGKTAIAHQIAYDLSNGHGPDILRGFQVVDLNLTVLVSGDSYRGVFEEKTQELITMLRSHKVILFIDEAHMMMGLGGMQNGQTPGLHDSFKRYMTDGTLRIIGATTDYEKDAILTDPAMGRRFFEIPVSNPTESAMRKIVEVKMNKLKGGYDLEEGANDLLYELMRSSGITTPDSIVEFIDFSVAYTRVMGMEEVTKNIVSKAHEKYMSAKIFKTNQF